MAKKDKNDKQEYLFTKYEQYIVNQHETRMGLEDYLRREFIKNVVMPRLGLDLDKGMVTWDSIKGIVFYDPIKEKKEKK